jgi:uncharacterized membrane protein
VQHPQYDGLIGEKRVLNIGSFLHSLNTIFLTIMRWLFGIAILTVIVWWLLPNDWRIKYAAEYVLDSDHVTIEHKPYDCDWDSAPIGKKHCHYDAVVTIYNQSGNVIEESGRMNRTPLDQNAAKVHIEWQRVDD